MSPDEIGCYVRTLIEHPVQALLVAWFLFIFPGFYFVEGRVERAEQKAGISAKAWETSYRRDPAARSPEQRELQEALSLRKALYVAMMAGLGGLIPGIATFGILGWLAEVC